MSTEKKAIPAEVSAFIEKVIENKMLWGLQSSEDDGWVVCDSAQFENTDVMPLWSSLELAKSHCTEEWASYTPEFISLNEFLEAWVEDLNDDGVLVGLDWQENSENNPELDVFDFAQELAAKEI